MLKQRIITAIVLVALASWALFEANESTWQRVLLMVGFVAAWEWAGFAEVKLFWQKLLYATFTTSVAAAAIELLSAHAIALLTLLESLLLIFVVRRYQRSAGVNGLKSCWTVLLSGLLAIVVFVVAMIQFRAEFSATTLLMSLMVIWAIDTGAYFTGRRFGKTKLAVHVSPGKTWEGVWGGVLLAFVVAWLALSYSSTQLSVSNGVFAAALAAIALFSVLGDLFESVLKRQVGLKDSGRILPGHGGILDRIDSLLIATPMLYLLWHFASVVK